MDTVILILICINTVFAIASIIIGTVILSKKDKRVVEGEDKGQLNAISNIINAANTSLLGGIKLHGDAQSKGIDQMVASIKESMNTLEARQDSFSKGVEYKFDNLKSNISRTLTEIREDNGVQLEKMRGVVEEKLQQTLETRLTQSFGIISDRLEKVHEGLNEMRNLTQNVTDLRRVLSGVKTRGNWGELSLGSLLEQIFAPTQYITNFAIGKNKAVVEYAIVLPGKDDSEIYLPIDAKFPIEDYQRLIDASYSGDKDVVEAMSKEVEKRIKQEARSIRDKYIKPPLTTDFAILYLPIEGLFAEVVKRSGLQETLQQSYNVLLAGPTTLTALLTSLKMGFKTVAIEKRSREIWVLMSEFRREFMRFSEILEKTEKQMDTATSSIRRANEKTVIIKKKLGNVELLDDPIEEEVAADEV